jgi:NADPH:quinone reductase-like Zn-dependent oxidoreductase
LTTKLFGKQRVVFPIPFKVRETIGFVQGLLGKGDFKPLIDPKIYGLDDIASAYEYAASGKKLGNIVVEIQDFPSK